MLLAPFTLNESAIHQRHSGRDSTPGIASWLLAWALGGGIAVALFPSLRGGGMAGMSVPFWLVAAPLINLAWLGRRQATTVLRKFIPGFARPLAAQPRVPSRLRSMRRRNSAMMRRYRSAPR